VYSSGMNTMGSAGVTIGRILRVTSSASGYRSGVWSNAGDARSGKVRDAEPSIRNRAALALMNYHTE
jgi:hypothetical protein